MTDVPLETQQQNQACGQRIRLAITICGLKIPLFARKYKISVSSLYSIEKGLKILTPKMAERLAQALLQEGCVCRSSWLLSGIGSPPYTTKRAKFNTIPEPVVETLEELLSSELKILKEIQLFQSLHPSSTVVGIFDDAMEPFYAPGDYVGGYFQGDPALSVNKHCIVYLENGDQLVRRLVKGTTPGLYHLQATNPLTTVKNPLLFNQTIQKASPIVWHRKKDF